MAQTSINIRMDENLKYDFEAVCNQMGLTMSAAFTVFAKSVSIRKEIPFKLTTKKINEYSEEWGHLSSDNLISAKEAAGAAGKWNNDINLSSIRKSAWADAAVRKEIKKQKDVKKHGTA